jgi:hypothetical protein
MTQPSLSILIPTVVGREENLNKLTRLLFGKSIGNEDMIGYMGGMIGEIHLVIAKDNKEMTIGQKRELLYSKAEGLYSIQIDDDDELAPNAIKIILEAIKSNPEMPCITFREKCIINGEYKSSNHSIKYGRWQDNFDGYDYVRTPFYKDVIRTDLAKSVPFPHIRWNEDEQWSYAIMPLLTSEIHIDEELYYYNYNETNPIERYGLDRT